MKTTKVFFTDRPTKEVVLYKTDLVIFGKPVFVEKSKRDYSFYIDNAYIVSIYKSNVGDMEGAKTELLRRFKIIEEAFLNKYIASCLSNDIGPEGE